jgi:hypothetical protein
VVAGREDECRPVYTDVPTRSTPRSSTRRGAAARDLLPASDDATRSSQRIGALDT